MRKRLLIVFVIFLVGCSQLKTDYCSTRTESINGINVFIEMLRSRNLRVDVWPSLNDQLYEGYDVILVFDKSSVAPSVESTESLWAYVEAGEATKLLYVARDLDVAAHYWETISKQLDADNQSDQAELAQEMGDAAREINLMHLSNSFDSEDAGWFLGIEQNRTEAKLLSKVLTSPETDEESPEDSEISCRWEIYRELIPVEGSMTLWRTIDNEPLLTVDDFIDFKIYAMGSGYPFLNGSLVDPTNRELVSKLIDQISPNGNIAIVTGSEQIQPGSSQFWRFLKVFPHPWIASQIFVFLVLFCLSRFPIYGRPRTETSEDLKRFGFHVEAVGELMRKASLHSFAIKRINEWKARRSSNNHTGVRH